MTDDRCQFCGDLSDSLFAYYQWTVEARLHRRPSSVAPSGSSSAPLAVVVAMMALSVYSGNITTDVATISKENLGPCTTTGTAIGTFTYSE